MNARIKQNNDHQKYKYNTLQSYINKKKINNYNNFQSDKIAKRNYSPYYKNHKKIGSDTASKDNQKILLEKRELEIKDLKMKCQKLEQENHRYQIQNILLKNNFINNNLDILSNNTSSNFPIRDEIKKIWENLAKVEILNNFIEFENQPEIIYHLICELFLLSNKMIKDHCISKYEEIIKIMGIKNNSEIIKDIETQFKTFMKEHLNEIFNYLQDKSFINEYKKQLKDIVEKNISSIKEDNIQLFEDILEQYEFNEMLKNINDIILFTHFNEPTLYFKIENKFENRKIYNLKINNDNKKNYIIVNDQGKFNSNVNAIVLLDPPCLKSGISFYNELKPIIMSVDKDIEEEFDNINEIAKFQIKDYIDNNNCMNKNEDLFVHNSINYEKEKEINEEEIKYNSINNTSRVNRNYKLETFDNNKDNEYNYMNFYTFNINNDENIRINNFKNQINVNRKYGTVGQHSFLEENRKKKNKILINTPRYSSKSTKRSKNLSISKDINNDLNSVDNDMYFKCKNAAENKKLKTQKKIMLNFPLNRKYNKIHRIKSENNYFDKNNNQVIKKKFAKQKTYFKNNKEINIIYNKYKQYISNNNNYNLKKNLIRNSSDENHSLSNKKNSKTSITFKKNKRNKIIKKDNKNYYITNNNKSSLTNNNTNKSENKINIKYNRKYINDKFLTNSKTKENLKSNNNLYKKPFLLMNKIKNNDIFSPLKKPNKNIEYFKKNIMNVMEKNKKINIPKNIICYNNIKTKMQNIKINFSNYNNNSNRNILNKNNLNSNFSSLSSNRTKKNEKRIDSFDQKNSKIYSAFEEIRKIMDDNHKPIIMITTNSNIHNNTINSNKRLTIKRHNFNRTIKRIVKKSKYNTINNSIKQLNCISQKKSSENVNINHNIGYIDNNNSKNKHSTNNTGKNYKQFSVDETTFNTSNKFNLTHDDNNKSNDKNKNYNLTFKIHKNKENATLYNEVIKSKSINNNLNMNTIKNRIKEIEINIDGLNINKKLNYNTIDTRSNKIKYHNIFNKTENKKIE